MKKYRVVNALPVALFIFAGNALTVGRAAEWTQVDFFIAFALSLLALPLTSVSADAIFKPEGMRGISGVFGKILYCFFSAVAVVSAFCISVLAVKEFAEFASEVMLLRMPKIPIMLIFLGLCGYLASLGAGAIKKFSLLAFFVTAAVAVMLFLLSVPSFESEYAKEIFSSSEATAMGTAGAFGRVFAPAAVAVIYMRVWNKGREGGKREAFVSPILAGAILFICFLNVRLLLGKAFGGVRDFPYFDAVSMVTVGKLFARMEGFAYVMYYGGAAVKTAVSVGLVCKLVEGLFPPRWRRSALSGALPYAVASLVLAASLIL